jgi:hypothetical protein
MDFSCPICKQTIPYELKAVMSHQDEHVVEQIKKNHPDWAQDDGICRKCYDYYKSQVRSQRN